MTQSAWPQSCSGTGGRGLPSRKAEAPGTLESRLALSCDRYALLSATLDPSGDQVVVNTSCLALKACVHAQLHPTLCNPVDSSPPGSSVHGIFQARILEWVAISSSRGSSRPRDQTHVSCISCMGRQILYHCTPWEAWLSGQLQVFSRKTSYLAFPLFSSKSIL